MNEQSLVHPEEKERKHAKIKTIKQALLFGMVGVLNTAVDMVVFFLLVHFLSVYYLLAQVLSYSAGTVNSYLWNSMMTFRGSKRTRTRFLKFVVLNVSVMGITIIVMRVLNFLPLPLNKLISTMAGLAINFFVSKFWVFRV
ncbi:MAG: GtrA family protein [Sporolactobacillus sp.]|jgi:putative flippase GtrA|nr:GtrA family protein [Sporolactobacillus sp.]